MKKALIHDTLAQNGGAEKCLASFNRIEIYCFKK